MWRIVAGGGALLLAAAAMVPWWDFGRHYSFLSPLAKQAPLFGMMISVLWMRQTKPIKLEMQSIADMAIARYDTLLSPLHVVLLALAAVALAVRVTSVQYTNFSASGVVAPELSVLMAVTGSTILGTMVQIHSFTKDLTATQRVAVYRVAYMAGDLCFRFTRICDLLAASNRALFVERTAEGLRAHMDWPTQWSCFLLGWLVGFMQPMSSATWRAVYLVLAFLSPLLPGLVGWLVSSRIDWLQKSARLLFLSQGIGFLLELTQRTLLQKVLEGNFRLELAIALPSAPLVGMSSRAAAEFSNSGGGGPSAAEVAAQAPGFSLADLEPVGILGFGSTAQVRLMRDAGAGGKLHAVKSIFKTRNGVLLSDKQGERVKQELSILREVHSHPFIIGLHGAFEDAHCFHIVLEYATNGSLALWLAERPLSEDIGRLATAELVSGLEHLHSMRIVYRDLKPENVLVQASGHVVLADFGTSRRLAASTADGAAPSTAATQLANTLVGTPGFMAPEVLSLLSGPDASAYSLPVDWWALGVIVHYMLTLEEPLQHDTIVDLLRGSAERANKVTRARISLEIGAAARSLVGSLLSFDPSTRLGTVGGAAEVQAHPFFASVDWTKLRTLRLPPPLQTLVLPVAQPKF